MSMEIASLDKVRAAAVQIRAGGGVATADRVIAHLGGGSKGTVLRHLKTLRDGDDKDDVVPPMIIDLARSGLIEIYGAGIKAGEDRSAAGLVRLTAAISEVEAQIDELSMENAILQQRIQSLQSDHDAIADRARDLQAELDKSARELQARTNELVLERGASAEKLAALMTRVEEGVASMSRVRETVRLPRDRQRSD